MRVSLPLLKWKLVRALTTLLPARFKIQTNDRYILEGVIFRDLCIRARYRKILFAGCERYTRWYPWIFEAFPGIRFETMEADPRNRRYGSRKHHRVGRVEDLKGDASRRNFYDLIILNGLFGYGTDTEQGIRAVLEAAEQALQVGGTLLIGFNDLGGPAHFQPEWVPEERFQKTPIPGMQESDFLAEGSHRHRFVCYVKR